jgi:hypothetical protein
MTDSLVNILVPYSRFLERQDRRRGIATELARRDQPSTIEPDVLPAPAKRASAQPLTANHADD